MKYRTHLSRCQVNEHVVKVTVAKANNVANHGHDSSGACVRLRGVPPFQGTGAATPQLPGK